MLKSHKQNIFEILGRNPIHPFPARMAPGIALDALGESSRSMTVLDPMAGSGTVLAVARKNGHRAIGYDIDPLAVLLGKVWTRSINAAAVRLKGRLILERATVLFRSLPSGHAYPPGSDDETRTFVRYWFDEYARRQLTALSTVICRVHDDSVRDVLWAALSRLIITKQAGASRAIDLSHSRPHRHFTHAPRKPFAYFSNAVETIIANCPQSGSKDVGPTSVVKLGDARKLDIKSNSIDLVLTSPPYLNAIDYLRCSKFSLVWMGYNVAELRAIRGESVGAEASLKEASNTDWVNSVIDDLRLRPALSPRHQAMLARYTWDMGQALSETSRVLRRGGRAVYVVGDSTVRSTFVRNSTIVSAVAARHGLSLLFRRSRSLPANRRYMPPPNHRVTNASMDGRMRKEVVLSFKKS